MVKGLTDSPGLNPNVAPLPGFRATSMNQSVYVILNATGVPQSAPAIYVPAGASVTIRAHNGTSTGNAGLVRLAQQPELLSGTQGDPLTPDSDVSWPCDHLGQVWIAGTAGDGVRISIQAGRR